MRSAYAYTTSGSVGGHAFPSSIIPLLGTMEMTGSTCRDELTFTVSIMKLFGQLPEEKVVTNSLGTDRLEVVLDGLDSGTESTGVLFGV